VSLKERIVEQIVDSVEAPVVNCNIGAMVPCGPYEIRQALNLEGLVEITPRNKAACENFSVEKAQIFYNEAGEAIDYSLPWCDPDVILDFAITAGLVLYGTDPASLLVGTGHLADGVQPWEEIEQGFNDLVYVARKLSRELLPPDPIYGDGANKYEVFCLCLCKNSACSAFGGEVKLSPLPLIKGTGEG